MNKIKSLIGAVLVGILAVGCDRVVPGYVAIKVDNWGDQKGVSDYPIRTGLVWYNPVKEDIYKFPTFVQNAVWDRDSSPGSIGDDSMTFNSIEGAIVNADIALAYSFIPEKVPSIFVEFRADPEIITHGFMKNEINNSFNRVASTMKASDIFGERKQYLLDTVRSNLNVVLNPKGFKFDLISFHGGLRVDPTVQARINAVLEASQRALEANAKVQQAKAEADQAIEKARGEKESQIAKAEGEARSTTLKAEAQAKANKILAESLTPSLIQYNFSEKWDGKLSMYNGSGAVPFFNISTNR
jgi:regulator of protease activity HflC (stomatin/prohibitin superfamily)